MVSAVAQPIALQYKVLVPCIGSHITTSTPGDITYMA
jgi:hypothetical protein